MSINIKEDKLPEVITNVIQIKNKNLIHIRNQRLENLNELFIKEQIINNSAKIPVENILKLVIKDNESGIE